jgi:hypothetical protein
MAPAYSAHGLAKQIAPHVTPDIPFYSVHTYEQTLNFYIKRTVTLVEFLDEMGFGVKQEPHRWVPTLNAFKDKWQGHARALAIMDHSTYTRLQVEGLPMRVIGEDVRRIVVIKP